MKFINLIIPAVMLLSSGCTASTRYNATTNDGLLVSGGIETVFDCSANADSQLRPEVEFWKGNSGRFDVRWTSRDLYVSAKEGTQAIFSDYARAWAQPLLDGQRGGKQPARNCINFNVLSIVGSLVSVEVDEAILASGSGLRDDEKSWITFDLSKPGKVSQSYEEGGTGTKDVDISELFTKETVTDALLSNEIIKRRIRETNRSIEKNPLIGGDPLWLETHGNEQLNGFSFNKFVFVDASATDVSIELEILQAFNTHVNEVKSLEISLPLSKTKLSSEIADAKAGVHGFLLNTRGEKLANARSSFVFQSK